MIVENHLVIEGNHQLKGEIQVKGAKNAVLKQMVLPLLCEGEYNLTNVPNITDVLYMQEVLEVLGIKTKLSENKLNIKSPESIGIEAPYELVQKMRASIIILGPLLARKGEAKIAFPGGDELGPRPVQMHLDALEKMGAKFSLDHGVLTGKTEGLRCTNKFALRISWGNREHFISSCSGRRRNCHRKCCKGTRDCRFSSHA